MALVLIAAIGLSAFTAAIVVMNRFGARVWLLALMLCMVAGGAWMLVSRKWRSRPPP